MIKLVITFFSLLSLFGFSYGQLNSDVNLSFHGAGWIKFGRIMAVSDTLTTPTNMKGSWIQDAGGLFNGHLDLNPEWEAAFGIGVVQNHKAQGTAIQSIKTRVGTGSFLSQAWFGWNPSEDKKTPRLKLNFGYFPYKYDNNIKNLGLYLIRGPVYPGYLFSGFETREMLPAANVVGLHMENNFGQFSQDVLIKSEVDFPPYFDLSLLYFAKYTFGDVLEVGAGAALYRLIPIRPSATTPGPEYFDSSLQDTYIPGDPADYIYSYPIFNADTSAVLEWIWPSNRGVKLMGRFSLDIKPLFGLEEGSAFLGQSDLKIYGETALLGVKNYKGIYDNPMERLPVMLGLNLPAFGFLDVLALEIEWYGAKFISDYKNLAVYGAATYRSSYLGRGISEEPYDVNADNVKWSLYFSKVIAGHLRLSGQVASDHFRMGGVSGEPEPTYDEAFTRISDWYWNLKATFFF